MNQLKINGVPTSYWCVVVPVDSIDIHLYRVNMESIMLTWYSPEFPLRLNNIIRVDRYTGDMKDYDRTHILGCITLSSMDEGVRELARKNEVFELYMDYMNEVFDTFRFRKPHESSLSLLQHNQITLTADTKAVVVKKI